MSALRALEERTGVDVFTVRDIDAEMVAAGTQYAESTVFKTVQRMKASPVRPPYARLVSCPVEA